jgi:hypothetical protein
MTTFLGKLGTQAENVYHAARYINPISWTQSFYSAVTDHVVLPTSNWIWTKLEKQSSVAEYSEQLPKRSKRCGKCLDPKVLYKVFKYVKECASPLAYMEPTKIPDQEPERFERVRNSICSKAEKTVIYTSRIIYLVTEIGEKALAVRLFVGDIGPQLRPSLNQHFVKPVVADLKNLITGDQKDQLSKDLFALVRAETGAVVEGRVVVLVGQYLADMEQQVTQRVTKMEENAQTKAISWLSHSILRESLGNYVITPALMSLVLSIPGYCHLETVSTAAYVISFFKYIHYLTWAATAGRSIYQMHQSCPPEFTDHVKNLLRRSLTKPDQVSTQENDFDPAKEIKDYSVVVSQQFNLQILSEKIKAGLPIDIVGVIWNDSASLQYLQRHFGNFMKDFKVKSEAALRKYDLTDSPLVEEVSEDKLPTVTLSPTSSVVADASLLDPLKPATPVIPPATKEDPTSSLKSDVNAVVSLATDVWNAASTHLTASPNATPIETDPEKGDDAKEIPPPILSWIQRVTATVVSVVGAIAKFLKTISPSFLSRLYGIFQGNSSVKSATKTIHDLTAN